MNLNKEMLKWSQTVYGVAHSLCISRSIYFGNLGKLVESLQLAEKWNKTNLGFESCIPNRSFKKGCVKLEGSDHEQIFLKISENIVKILFINLAVIADETLGYLIKKSGNKPGNYLINKIEWSKSRINPELHWSINGMLELVAIRNALVHNEGRWNESSIQILKKAGIGSVDRCAIISLSFADLFRYRRALRTLAGELRKLTPAGQENVARVQKKVTRKTIREK